MSYLYYKAKRVVLNTTDRCLRRSVIPKRMDGRTVLSIEESSNSIYEFLQSPDACMLCRFGTSEMGIINNYFDIHCLHKAGFSEEKRATLTNNAGYFGDTTDAGLSKFAELYLDSCTLADGVALLTRQEEYVVHKYMKSAQLYTLRGLEPYYSSNPWSRALEGKKVLVIHPFAKSIEKQYANRDALFEDRRMLPEFELKTLKAVQTIAGTKDGRFENWFEALDYMTKEALKVDFDVAIIGCGAYGLPLAAKIKEAGRKAVHLGGATQLLFGIKGGRWDNHPIISKLYNSYWVRPGEEEIVENKKKVENGCYW